MTGTTAVTTGDLLLACATANPDVSANNWDQYGWAIATNGAAINNAGLRLGSQSGAGGSAPTFCSGSRFSSITPSATATDNGSTNGGTLAVSVGDAVYASLSGEGFKWHVVTTAGNMSSDSGEGTAGVDGKTAGNSLVTASSPMSKIAPVASGLATATTTLSDGDIIFAHATAGASGSATAYDWHFASAGAAVNSANLRLDNAPANLAVNTTYKVSIGSEITDLAGNKLGATSTITFATNANDPTNVKLPPNIIGSIPTSGSFSFPTNGNVFIKFPDDDGGKMLADGSLNAVNNAANVYIKKTSYGAETGSALAATLSYSSTIQGIKIDPTSNLATGTEYVAVVKQNVQNTAGQTATTSRFIFFNTGSGADTTAPTFQSIDPKVDSTGVARDIPSVMAQFSEGMDPTTITSDTVVMWADSNGDGVQDGGETVLTVNRKYDYQTNALFLGLQTILAQNTKYCVKVTTGAKDTAGNAVASNTTKCFTSANTSFTATAPKVLYADGDTFGLWVEFDRSVDFTAGANGALNKANYTVENPIGTTISLNNATLAARPEARAVEITGLALQPNTEFKVTVVNINDTSGGAKIVADGTGNVGRGTVMDPFQSGSFMGSMDMPDFQTTTNFSTFWESPSFAEPYNRLPEQTSRWRVEFPAPASLATNSTIILTFPSGFDVTNAAIIGLAASWDNNDVNGSGPGTTTLSALSSNISSRTVTVTLAHSGTAMLSGDQLRFELDGIKNPTSAGQKQISAIVKDANGIKQGQTINFSPFDIYTAGSRSVAGTVCKGSTSGGTCTGSDTGLGGVKIFLDGFMGMGGRMETTTNASGDFTFSSLNNGTYSISIHMDMTSATMTDLGGSSQYKTIDISGSNLTDIDFKMANLATTGKTLTVNITGGPKDNTKQFDVFCNSNESYQFSAPVVKFGTFDANGAATLTLKLQPNTTYQCMIGPHMPFESFTAGGPPPVPDFDFLPFPPKTIVVANADLSVSFELKTTDNQIVGKIVDSSGSGIANVYVDAFPSGGKAIDASTGGHVDMGGSFAQTKSDGTFILKVIPGTYEVGACASGMPCSGRTMVDVKANSNSSDGNTTADVYENGTLLTGTGLTIKLGKSSTTISGQLLDENSSGIKYGFVDAELVGSTDTCTSFTSKGVYAGSPTDQNGNYTIYIPPSLESQSTTWLLRGNAPAYGQVGCKAITVTANTSKTGQNIQATATDFGKVKITAQKDGTAVEGAFVGCYGPNGGNHDKTGTDGTVTLRMNAGTYTCEGFLSGAGPLPRQSSVSVTGGNTTNVTMNVANVGTISVNMGTAVGSSTTKALCTATDSNGQTIPASYEGSAVSIKAPAGDYTLKCSAPEIGEIFSSSVTVASGETTSVDKTTSVPTLYTISGEIEDNSGTNVSGSSVVFTDQSNGRKVFAQTTAASGSSPNVSVQLPAGTYSVQALKSGYYDNTNSTGRPQVITVSANASITKRELKQASGSNVSVTVQDSGANFGGKGRVIATRSDGKVEFGDIDATVSSGANSTLSLSPGTWTIEARTADGRKTGSTKTVVVNNSGTADSSPTISVDTAITGFTYVKATKKTFTPSIGGTITDDNVSGLEVKLNVADANDSTTGTIELKKSPDLPQTTSGGKLVGTTGYNITPKSSEGKELHDATGEVKIPITNADLVTAGLIANADTATAAQITTALTKVSIGRLNNLGEYQTLSTTAVKDGVASGTHLLVASTDGFSDFAPITAADNAPSTPTGLAVTSKSSNSISLSWTATSGATGYNLYRDTSSSGSFARIGSVDPVISSGSTTTYTDTGLKSGTTYYYKIGALNDSGESAASSAVNDATNSGGGGGGGSSTGPAGGAGATQVTVEPMKKTATATTASPTEKAQVVLSAVSQKLPEKAAEAVTVAITNLEKVSAPGYTAKTLAVLKEDIGNIVASISKLSQEKKLDAPAIAKARQAVKNLLVETIKVTIEKVKERILKLSVPSTS